MRQVIKKNVEALVEMIDKMRSSIVKPVLKPQDEDTKNEYLRIMTAVIEEKLYADVQMDRDTFASRMNKGRKETLTTRIISTTFMVVALAVFKPFGLDAWQWQAYVHLLALGVMGILICMLTDALLKYVVRKPRSYDKGVSYIIDSGVGSILSNILTASM